MTSIRLPRHALLVLVGALLLAAAFAAPALAGPPEDMAKLAQRLDMAIESLEQGDQETARTEYQAFEDGWEEIEAGVREQSGSAYLAIETAMVDAGLAMSEEPFNTTASLAALRALRSSADDFIQGRAVNQPQATEAGEVSLASLPARIDRALSSLEQGDQAAADAEVTALRREWIQVEGAVLAKSPGDYAAIEQQLALASSSLRRQPTDVPGARSALRSLGELLAPYTQGEIRYGPLDAAAILLREGLEALLVVGALVALLNKMGQPGRVRWVWGGAAAALLASVVLALALSLVLSSAASAVSREVLEGVVGLVAAIMLVWVGHWLHSQARLKDWQHYLRERTESALTQNRTLLLSAIAFLAVFREGAETILFFAAIAPSTSLVDLALGSAGAVAALVVCGVLILTFGVRLPLRPLFAALSVFVFVLAFKFVGVGISALQVADVIQSTPAPFLPSIDLIGLFPTWEPALAQFTLLVAAAMVLLVEWANQPEQPAAPSVGSPA